MTDYLHGIAIEESQPQAVLAAGDSSVIGIIGTAPIGKVKEAVLITSKPAGVVAFGEDIGGFTIPSALDFIFSHCSAKVIVINVLDNADATALIQDGKMTKADGKFATHIFEATLPTAVDFAADIIEGIDLMMFAQDQLGIKPDVLIAPGYSQLAAVRAELILVANKLNAFDFVDIVADTTSAAVAAKTTGAFASTSKNNILCWPNVIRYNSHEKENQEIALSVAAATAKVITDSTYGFWISPSNTELAGILATKVKVISSLTDPTADTNLLNGAGIMTVFMKAGTSYRTWGNWTGAFPTVQSVEAMIAPRSVRMNIREALLSATLTYLDKNNITKFAIELIVNDVNAFIRDLIGKKAIVLGSCSWDSENNTSSEISLGKLRFKNSIQYAPSLDLLIFEEEVDTNYIFN